MEMERHVHVAFQERKRRRELKLPNLVSSFREDVLVFAKEYVSFCLGGSVTAAKRFEKSKGFMVASLYRQRGKMAKRLMHSGMAGIAAFGVMVAPIVAEEFPGSNVDPWEAPSPSNVLSATTENELVETVFSDGEYRDSVVEYEVKEGDTVSSIAEKFGISSDTIRWENDLQSKDSIKVGQTLEILPVTGVSHKVSKGDTVYSIAKKYDIDPQGIVNYPFNTFVNDETFELAIGQTLMVPEGVIQSQTLWSPVARVRQTYSKCRHSRGFRFFCVAYKRKNYSEFRLVP